MITETEYEDYYKVLARDTSFGESLNEKFAYLDEILTETVDMDDEDSLLFKSIKDTFLNSKEKNKEYLDVKLERRIDL